MANRAGPQSHLSMPSPKVVSAAQAFRLAEQVAVQASSGKQQAAAAGPPRPALDASAVICHVRAAQGPFALLQVKRPARKLINPSWLELR